MCGITGIYAKNLAGQLHMINLSQATDLLTARGPDWRGVWTDDFTGLGHRRLSVIDTSENAAQPMQDATGRYVIVYNGEIYNFKALRESLLSEGYTFRSGSDTEVLLYSYIRYKEGCLDMLNGFFAFAVYDRQEKSLFLARDRFGIKPLYYYDDEDKFIFASDMKSVLAYGIEKKLDTESLFTYLQLNYIPAPHTMLQGVHMLEPGKWLKIHGNEVQHGDYYHIQYDREQAEEHGESYEEQKKYLRELVEDSVRKRLISDVPLGTFLSGGIDSSIISGIAKKYKDDLHTFSVGYRDEPFFDETNYANLVAEKFNTHHTVFSLTNEDLYEDLFDILDAFDQPFADSSSIPTYILSKKVREHITVALSGDGADELFSGYNKHVAHLKAMEQNSMNSMLSGLVPFLKMAPKSRNGTLSNKIRQAQKFAEGLKLPQAERYWRWAGFLTEKKAYHLLSATQKEKLKTTVFHERKAKILSAFSPEDDFNEVLLVDMRLVLPDDMLRKVDMMSMAHGLEVRVPYLDHNLVDYVFQLPTSSKITPAMRKRVLQDAFADMLPRELYRRPKKGFEVPLLKWFRTSLKSMIKDDLLGDKFIEEQQVFDPREIRRMKKRLFSMNPGDAHATVWALIVFQWWWKRYFS